MMPRTYTHWTTKEIARLRQVYAGSTDADLEREFAPRKASAIRSRARQLKIRKLRDWVAIAQQHRPVFDFGRAQ